MTHLNRRKALAVVASVPAVATLAAVPALAAASNNPYENTGGGPRSYTMRYKGENFEPWYPAGSTEHQRTMTSFMPSFDGVKVKAHNTSPHMSRAAATVAMVGTLLRAAQRKPSAF